MAGVKPAPPVGDLDRATVSTSAGPPVCWLPPRETGHAIGRVPGEANLPVQSATSCACRISAFRLRNLTQHNRLMDKIAKYQMPPALGSDYTWKEMILIPVIVLGLLFAVVAFEEWRDPSCDIERSHLYRAAFSHPAITSITGITTDVSFALIPKEERRFWARSVPEDWKRRRNGDLVQGTARMFISGKRGHGIFTLTYRYIPSTDSFALLQIEELDRPLIKDSPSSHQSDRKDASAFQLSADRLAVLGRRDENIGLRLLTGAEVLRGVAEWEDEPRRLSGPCRPKGQGRKKGGTLRRNGRRGACWREITPRRGGLDTGARGCGGGPRFHSLARSHRGRGGLGRERRGRRGRPELWRRLARGAVCPWRLGRWR